MAEETTSGIASSRIEKTTVTDKPVPKPLERQTDTSVTQEGEKVNKSDFSDEEWARLVETGAVVESMGEYLRRPTTKTADVQATASDASPSSAPAQETDEGYSVDELNERANASAKREAEIRRDLELDEETRAEIARLPAEQQRNAFETKLRDAINEELGDQSSSADEEEETGDEYDQLEYRDLQARAKERDLDATGSAEEIADRLRADDAAKAGGGT